MVDIEKYIRELIRMLQDRFDTRLIYVGLQGSYLRGEATESSDIDIMVVVDVLQISDLEQYRAVIRTLPYSDRSCGFICSKSDLAHWNPLEVCHVLHSTKDYYGELGPLLPAYTEEDICNFVKLSVNNLYHELCHRYIHSEPEKTLKALPGMYKGVFFILQNFYYLQQREYIGKKRELLQLLEGENRGVLQRSLELACGMEYDFLDSFELLFTWCQNIMHSL